MDKNTLGQGIVVSHEFSRGVREQACGRAGTETKWSDGERGAYGIAVTLLSLQFHKHGPKLLLCQCLLVF